MIDRANPSLLMELSGFVWLMKLAFNLKQLMSNHTQDELGK
ncbi:hypothetical protein N8482_00200 [Chitinophagales bacterium]|nr:hypothetical protein [Chitinophagales bacterium]